ncbi:MAG: NnrS family protein [Candidatus Acidiferrales bacterium]
MAKMPSTTSSTRPVWLDDETKSIMEHAIAREQSLSRLLMTYIVTGFVFMLLPGTFLGVWNLIKISSREEAESISPAWIQAHGHAQLFGWVGTFILGIGFYSIPKLRKLKPFALWSAWLTWALWVIGVTVCWFAKIYPWHWRIALPLSATLELAAFLIFFQAVASHRPSSGSAKSLEPWIFVVIAATVGLLASLLLNLGASFQLALNAGSPAFPHLFDQRYLIVSTWGFIVPMVWGFSARWLPVFMGLRPLRNSLLLVGLGLNTAGVILGFLEYFFAAGILLLAGAAAAVAAIRFFETALKPAKTVNVHQSFPVFIRIAYGWLLTAAALSIWAALAGAAPGIWGASRHALTVGFIAAMIFCVGQRILPSFCGMRVLWSPRLMLVMLVLLMTGCTLRVASEILAYQNYATWAWSILPVSALVELTAVALFAINLIATFVRPPVVVASPLTMTTE